LDNAVYNAAWSEFINVLGKRELPRLDRYHKGFTYRIPEAGILLQNGSVTANVQYPGMIIRYTADGSIPHVKSKRYVGPIAQKGTIAFRVFNGNGRAGKTVFVINR